MMSARDATPPGLLAAGVGGEHRAEDRRADGAAERAEEPRGGRGDAELAAVDAVLHGDDQHLRDHPEAEPEQARPMPVASCDGSPASAASSTSAAVMSASPEIGKRL